MQLDHLSGIRYGNKAMGGACCLYFTKDLSSMRKDVDLKKSKTVETVAKKLKFAGYEFSSRPDGTVIHRETVRDIQLHVGDRVIYKDDILRRHRGILNRIDGRWAFVLWDRWPEHGAIKEWLANLCKA